MQMGIGELRLRSRANSSPVSPGIITSRMTRSNARPRMAARAHVVSCAIDTRNPAPLRKRVTSSRIRWSSSTTRMCGALSGGGSRRSVCGSLLIGPLGVSPAECARCFHRTLDHGVHGIDRSWRLDDAGEERRRRRLRPWAGTGQGLADPIGLQRQQPDGELAALVGRVQAPLPAVDRAGSLEDIALVDQLLEHPRQTLLGDLEDAKQVGDPQPRIAIDEMQYAVVRTSEAQLGKYGIRLGDEIPIGEEQKFHHGHQSSLVDRRSRDVTGTARRVGRRRHRTWIYVSHVDIFDADRYARQGLSRHVGHPSTWAARAS